MIDDKNKTEIIELYLQGRLTDELIAEFNKKLSNDQDFKNEVELQHAIMRNAVRVGRQEMKQALKQIHTEITFQTEDNAIPIKNSSQDSRTHKSIPSLRISKIAFGVAASLILLAIIIFYTSLSPHELFTQQFKPYQTALFRTEEQRNELILRYEQKDYSGSIQEYEAHGSNSIKETFIAGNGYLMLSQPDKAISCFERVIKFNKNIQPEKRRFLEDAEYYKALAYLDTNRLAEAEVIFKKIQQDASHTYNNKVTRLLLIKIKLLKIKLD